MPRSTLKIKLHHNYEKVSFSDTIAQSHIKLTFYIMLDISETKRKNINDFKTNNVLNVYLCYCRTLRKKKMKIKNAFIL